MHMNLKEWDQAKPFLEEAIEKGEELNDVPRLTKALIAMGDFTGFRRRIGRPFLTISGWRNWPTGII